MSVIIVSDLHKHYGDVKAVDGISFEVAEGEIFSLLGPNGAGKTTTLSILSGLLRPDSGEASVCGHSIHREPLSVKSCIGVVPQEIALYDELSARQNLHFWGQMYGLAGKELAQRADEVLELIGLVERADGRVSTYSGGMKRRLNIGVGLLHHPRVIFMDEPTVGIDPQSRRAILDRVKSLNVEGLTVLYTTHYMEEAQELSSRVGIMDHGKLIAMGTQDELTRLVGAQDHVTLSVGQDGDRLVEALKGTASISQVTSEDGQVRFLCEDANVVLPQVFFLAAQADVRVRSVEIQEPNLEAVFLHLTGRALRD